MKPLWEEGGSMKLKVLSFDERFDAHYCTDENGGRVLVDILVDGSLPNKDRQYYVGKEIFCQGLTGYLMIAHDVTLTPPTDRQTDKGEV
jgi:hypothetical protein